ncbi:MAG: hypothetical protein JW944_11660 [Deltaproteobacteria bacterium]|nr:hypothetical protein [Deltaproteobacteria bacterium]
MQLQPGYNPIWFYAAASLISVIIFTTSEYKVFADEKHASAGLTAHDMLTLDIAGQINPEGLRMKTGFFRRWVQEMNDNGEPSRHLQTGLGFAASPAYTTLSLHGEWKPAVFINMRIEYNLIQYLGAYTGLLSFPDKNSKFGDEELDRLEGREEPGTGQKICFRPTLYAKAGPVTIMNRTDLSYFRFNGSGPYFMEIEYDTLLRDDDYVFDNSISFLVSVLKGKGSAAMYLGPYYSFTRAHHSGITRQRTGAQMFWIVADTRWGMIRPRFYSQATFCIEDRNREGELSFAAGFSADFDL